MVEGRKRDEKADHEIGIPFREGLRQTGNGKQSDHMAYKRHLPVGHRCQFGRAGALFSLELLLVLPILWIVFSGVVELSLILIGLQKVQAASSAACRVGTLPAGDLAAQDQAMRDAAIAALQTPGMVNGYQMTASIGQYSGDPVVVEISVPMVTVAPDMLKVIGFTLQGRQLVARTEMCKQ